MSDLRTFIRRQMACQRIVGMALSVILVAVGACVGMWVPWDGHGVLELERHQVYAVLRDRDYGVEQRRAAAAAVFRDARESLAWILDVELGEPEDSVLRHDLLHYRHILREVLR